MDIGFIGLGRMGSRMVLNLLDKKQKVVVYNRSSESTKVLGKKGALPTYSLEEFVKKLPKKKIIWLMVSSQAVDQILADLISLLSPGDIIIDGGNSFYKDSIRRYHRLKEQGIHFLDVGTSGGLEGARTGACLMVGGSKEVYKKVEPLFKALATKEGYAYVGETGAGHFTKMVHNGIEYGMMAALGEGLEAISKHKQEFNFDLKEIVKVYNNGSIIESRLVSWIRKIITKDPELTLIEGTVPLGETEEEMKHLEKISYMPILHQSILERIKSRTHPNFRSKIVAALRNEFGGHKVLNKIKK